MAGYSKTPLVKKLGIKAGFKIRIINSPENYFDLLESLPEAVVLIEDDSQLVNFIHLFAKDLATFHDTFPPLESAIEKDGIIWVSWYKKASKIPTDLTEHLIRSTALSTTKLVDVKKCAVDEKWSGLKFMIRKELR